MFEKQNYLFNPLGHGRFSNPYFKVLREGGKTKFLDFFIGASATKRFARSRIFKYGLPPDILSKRQSRQDNILQQIKYLFRGFTLIENARCGYRIKKNAKINKNSEMYLRPRRQII